jgi:tetratricopeptide (TPR) repeat protein
MRLGASLAVIVGSLLLGACAGVGIVATSDPRAKLEDAEDLFMRQGRPLPAERLIREATAIYEERNDSHGLANAYRDYGDLLRSPAVAKWETVYRRDGFLDKSVTFDNRSARATEHYLKALQYYRLAEQQYRDARTFDRLTNVYYNMAGTHLKLGERDKGCSYYDQSVGTYAENIKQNPTAKPYVPPGSGSFADFIATAKRRAGCQ